MYCAVATRSHSRARFILLLHFQVFILPFPMSIGPDTPLSSSVLRPLEHALESVEGVFDGSNSECNQDGTSQTHGHNFDVSGVHVDCSRDEFSQSHLHSDGLGVGADLVSSQQVVPGDFQVLQSQALGPTVVDSDDGVATQDLHENSQQLDGYELLDGNELHEVDDTILDTGFGSGDGDIDWLLHLEGGSAGSQDMCTERLAKDEQSTSGSAKFSLPGFGVDHSSWALGAPSPKFFWETDPFLGEVFGEQQLNGPDLKRPAVCVDLTVGPPTDVVSLLQRPKHFRVSGLCEQVIKHVEMRDETDKRQSVISNWTSLVCINLEAFSVGDAIMAGGDRLTHADVEVSLQACFARKATSTLAKRFYALNRFVNFCGQRGMQFFPLREHVVFTFLQSMLNDEKAAASAGRSFLEACRFAQGVLGLRSDLAELGTSRVEGVAVEINKRAAPLVQAAPLLVSQVIALEKLVTTADDLKDKVMFGAMLILLYGCGRFSDGQRAVNILMDVNLNSIDPTSLECPGYLELQVLGNKGARSAVLRRTYLPLVAPIFSLGSVDWFRAWTNRRGKHLGWRSMADSLCPCSVVLGSMASLYSKRSHRRSVASCLGRL